jgi:transcriptional regulator with XRE-family HTH domain
VTILDTLDKILKILATQKKTQKELAEKIGVPQQNISRWETGEVIPKIDKLKLIAEVLGCTINDLI